MDLRALHESRRALRQERVQTLDEMLGGVAVAGDELDVEFLEPSRQHAHGRDLRVVDVDDLALERAELRAPERDVLDDALQLHRRDRDRVADGVPLLGEHAEPRDDVDENALRREADQDEHEGRARDGRQVVEPTRHLSRGEHERRREGDVGDAGADDPHGRLAPLELDDLGAEIAARRMMAPVVPDEDLARDKGRQARDCPRRGEQEDDREDMEHLLQPSLNPKVQTGLRPSQAPAGILTPR
ncbi:MAG TPA: hypothetical protein VIU81_11605 [Gaiellaceae bacterium]